VRVEVRSYEFCLPRLTEQFEKITMQVRRTRRIERKHVTDALMHLHALIAESAEKAVN
jgi:hypothetical protein